MCARARALLQLTNSTCNKTTLVLYRDILHFLCERVLDPTRASRNTVNPCRIPEADVLQEPRATYLLGKFVTVRTPAAQHHLLERWSLATVPHPVCQAVTSIHYTRASPKLQCDRSRMQLPASPSKAAVLRRSARLSTTRPLATAAALAAATAATAAVVPTRKRLACAATATAQLVLPTTAATALAEAATTKAAAVAAGKQAINGSPFKAYACAKPQPQEDVMQAGAPTELQMPRAPWESATAGNAPVRRSSRKTADTQPSLPSAGQPALRIAVPGKTVSAVQQATQTAVHPVPPQLPATAPVQRAARAPRRTAAVLPVVDDGTAAILQQAAPEPVQNEEPAAKRARRGNGAKRTASEPLPDDNAAALQVAPHTQPQISPPSPPPPPLPRAASGSGITRQLEQSLQARGYAAIGGVDEAGRGPLAGPVVAAVCVIPPDVHVDGIDDSKVLTEEQREVIYEQLTTHPRIQWAACVVDHNDIDRLNILQATMTAMRGATMKLPPGSVNYLLVDGNRLPTGLPTKAQAVIGGDASCYCIAAASVIAKVTRDRIMVEYEKQYPGYGFGQHKGYCVPSHVDAIQRLGPCEIHRRSFNPVRTMLGWTRPQN